MLNLDGVRLDLRKVRINRRELGEATNAGWQDFELVPGDVNVLASIPMHFDKVLVLNSLVLVEPLRFIDRHFDGFPFQKFGVCFILFGPGRRPSLGGVASADWRILALAGAHTHSPLPSVGFLGLLSRNIILHIAFVHT
jgi:hypothetical protein